jgi:CBS domain-containing protein
VGTVYDESRRGRQLVVREVMSAPVATVAASSPVKLVAEVMLASGVSALPVVDAHGRPVGIVSEADLLLKEFAAPTGVRLPWFETKQMQSARRRGEALTAADLMTTPVVTVRPETTLHQAARLMYERRIKRLPVTDGDSLVGVISRSDVLKVFLIPDEHLRRVASRALHSALGRDGRSAEVSVRDGMLTVHGEVATHSEADLIQRLLSGIDGVLGVHVDVTWRIDDHLGAEIKRRAHV